MALDYGPPSSSPSPDPPEAQMDYALELETDHQLPPSDPPSTAETATQTDLGHEKTTQTDTQTDTTLPSSVTETANVNNDDNDGDVCDADGSLETDVRTRSKLSELVPDIERHFPCFFSGLATGMSESPFKETARHIAARDIIVERVLGRIKQKQPGPHFGPLHQAQSRVLPAFQALRQPEWSVHSCRTCSQLGYGAEDLDAEGLIKAKPLPGPEEIVPPILVTAALTFPVNELHLNAHSSVQSLDQDKYKPCFSMALLGALVSEFPWAKNFLATDTLAFAMPPSAKISWHGPTTQAAFDLALERILAIGKCPFFSTLPQGG
ncbi:unnamed protein product [Tilletia controversa]|nr:unnamed protein product [Tilletia controversa]